MQPTLLANTWMAAHLPDERYLAVLCCAGSAGEAAFHNALDDQFAGAGPQSPRFGWVTNFGFGASSNRQPFASSFGTIVNQAGTQEGSSWGAKMDLTALRCRRAPMYHVLGTTIDDTGVSTATARIARTRLSLRHPPVFHHAQVVGNPTVMLLQLSAFTLDLASLMGVRKLPDGFMSGCTSLVSVKLPLNVNELGASVLRDCTSLTMIDMSSLMGVRKLPEYFMSGCTSLVSVKLPLNVNELGASVLSDCTSLTMIDMSSLMGVRKLPDYFMSGCASLVSVKLPPKIVEVGVCVLIDCPSLNEHTGYWY